MNPALGHRAASALTAVITLATLVATMGCASVGFSPLGSSDSALAAESSALLDQGDHDPDLRAPRPAVAPSLLVAPRTPVARSRALAQLYADYWEASLQLQPVRATYLGDGRYNDRLPDFFSAEFRTATAAFHRAWLASLRAIDSDGLDGQDLLSYRILEADLQDAIERERFPSWKMPIDQLSNIAVTFAELGSGRNAQPFATVQDHEAWLARARRIPRLLVTMQHNMRVGMHDRVVPSKAVMQAVLPQLDALIATRAEDSVFWEPIAAWPKHLPHVDRDRLAHDYRALIEGELMPAYRALRAFIADQYLEACRDTVGMGELPDGAAWYAFRIRMSTSLELAPDEVHALGVREVARIRIRMQELKQRLGFKGTLEEFFAHVRDDERFAFKSEQQMLRAFRVLRAKVSRRIPRLFTLRPKASFEIRPVEDVRAASDPAGSYRQPAPDGKRPGIFFVNTFDLPSRKTWDTESLFLHEAIPGHHYQIALQQELAHLPAFRRYGGETVFEEGWALYAESLGKTLGLYTDPYQEFGRLQAQLWRAIRLVVDTGLHAKGWTRDEVIDYMKRNSAVSDAEAVSEADRYIANPGQALAYKIGEMKLHELRARARRALGAAFDVREFHAAVLEDGSLPLPMLENKITRFIAERRVEVARAGADKVRAR